MAAWRHQIRALLGQVMESKWTAEAAINNMCLERGRRSRLGTSPPLALGRVCPSGRQLIQQVRMRLSRPAGHRVPARPSQGLPVTWCPASRDSPATGTGLLRPAAWSLGARLRV